MQSTLKSELTYKDSDESDNEQKQFDKQNGVQRRVLKVEDLKLKVKAHILEHALDKEDKRTFEKISTHLGGVTSTDEQKDKNDHD